MNGPADPFVASDEDPTVVRIVVGAAASACRRSRPTSPATRTCCSPGDTLRYTITVKNIGTEDVTDAMFRDSVPANTSYVAGSTTLNGSAGAGRPGRQLAALGRHPDLRARGPDAGRDARGCRRRPTTNVATIVFDVVIDAGVIDGTVISNQALRRRDERRCPSSPRTIRHTAIPDDPTRDVVGNEPLLVRAEVGRALGGQQFERIHRSGRRDPLHDHDLQPVGAVPATGVVLTDSVPANTTYVADSTTLNGSRCRTAGRSSPLAAGSRSARSISRRRCRVPARHASPRARARCVEFDLQVNAGVPAGTLISNQAVVGTNELPDLLTDGDGNPATGPEPTVVVVGDAQQLTITQDGLGGGRRARARGLDARVPRDA